MQCPLTGNQFSETAAEKPVQIPVEMAQKTPKTNARYRIAPTPVRIANAFAFRDLTRMPKKLCSGFRDRETPAPFFHTRNRL
jgi:hypothetical protein